MNLGNIFWLIFLAIVAFLILSRAQAATNVLNAAGGRFIETLGVLQGREVASGSARIGGIVR